MSEFPFAESVESEDSTGDKKKVLLVGGLAAAVLVGAGGFFLLSGGDAEEDTFVLPKRPAQVAPAAAKPAAKAVAKVPVTYAAPVGRDPFRALYTVPAAAAGGGTTTGGTTTPVTTTPTQAPTSGGTVVITPTKAPTSSGSTTSTSQSTIRFKAYDTFTKTGTFVLDGKTTETGKVGSTIAKKVLVIAIRPDREPGAFFATLKVGDGSNFDAHFGQTVVIP
jgi:hypothetical protein